MKESTQFKREARIRRQKRVRRKVAGSAGRPRLSVFRGHRHIFAQLIDDEAGVTLAEASSLKAEGAKAEEGEGRKCAVARAVGGELARKAQEKGIEAVVFDRGGYQYHGRVAALAKGAREGGLKF